MNFARLEPAQLKIHIAQSLQSIDPVRRCSLRMIESLTTDCVAECVEETEKQATARSIVAG